MLQNPTNVYPFNQSVSLDGKTSFSFIHHGSDVKYVALNIYDALDNSLVARYFSPNRLNEYDQELTLKNGDEFSMLLENLSDVLKPAKEYKYNYTLYQDGGFSATNSFEEILTFDKTDARKNILCRCVKSNLKQITLENIYSANIVNNIVKVYPGDLGDELGSTCEKILNLNVDSAATITVSNLQPIELSIQASAACKIKIKVEYYTNVAISNLQESNYNIFHTSTYVSDEVNNDMVILDVNNSILDSKNYVPCYGGLNIPPFMYDYNGLNIGGMAISINDIDIGYVDYYTSYADNDDVYYMKLISPLKRVPRAGDRINIYKNFITTPMYGFTVRTKPEISPSSVVKCGEIDCNSTYTINNIDFKENIKSFNWSIIKQEIIDSFNILEVNDSKLKIASFSLVFPEKFEANRYLDPVSGASITKTGYYTSSFVSLNANEQKTSVSLSCGVRKITFNKPILGASFYSKTGSTYRCVGYCEPVKTIDGVNAMAILNLRESAGYVRVCLNEEDITSTKLTMKWEALESNISLDSYVTSSQIPVAYYTSDGGNKYITNVGKYLGINGDYKKIKALTTRNIKRRYICYNDGLEHTLHFDNILGMWTLEFGDILITNSDLDKTTRSLSKTTDYGYVDINSDAKGTIKFGRTIPSGATIAPSGGVLDLSIKNSIFVYVTEPFVNPPQSGDACVVLNDIPITLYSTENFASTTFEKNMPFIPNDEGGETYYTKLSCTNKYNEIINLSRQLTYDDYGGEKATEIIIRPTECNQGNYGIITYNGFEGNVYKLVKNSNEHTEPTCQDLQIVFSGKTTTEPIVDYTASSGNWEYIFCSKDATTDKWYTQKKSVSYDFHSWDICSLSLIKDDYRLNRDRYAITEKWHLECNASPDGFSQNQDISMHDSLSAFPLKTVGSNNYISGGLSCLIGDIDNGGEYVDTYDKVRKWNNFITQNCAFMLKSPKGDVWVVVIDSSTEREYDYSFEQIPTQVSFKFTQVDDIKNIIVDSEV